jgi:protein transport protein SEC24
LDSAFIPLPKQKLFIKASEWAKNESLFDKLLKLIGTTEETHSALGCAVLSAKLALQDTGGNIKVFATKLPDSGMGKTGPRDYRLYGTDSERALFIPEDDFFIQAAQECAKYQISVDTFVFPTGFVDTATLG